MLTQFGLAFREIRIKHGLLLKDVAEKLSKQPSFISGIEHGDKAIPDGYVMEVCKMFNFDSDERHKLLTAEAYMRNKATIENFNCLLPLQQELAVGVAQELKGLSKQRMEKILAIMRSEDDEPTDTIISSTMFND